MSPFWRLEFCSGFWLFENVCTLLLNWPWRTRQDGAEWIHLANDKDKLLSLTKTVKHLRVPLNDFLDRGTTLPQGELCTVELASYLVVTLLHVGRDNSVGIAIRYWLDGPGIEARQGDMFRTRPDRPWALPSLLHNGYWVPFGGLKRQGRDIDHPLPSSAEVKERVKLYLYSPSGPSWPVLGWTLPLPYLIKWRLFRLYLPSAACR